MENRGSKERKKDFEAVRCGRAQFAGPSTLPSPFNFVVPLTHLFSWTSFMDSPNVPLQFLY